jgi:hypothetical protein
MEVKMEKLDKNKTGLVVGFVLALMHAVWALFVAITPGGLQTFLDWVFKVHFLEPVWILTAFNFLDAIFLVILTFVCGFILGWVFAAVHNWLSKKK